MVVNKITGVSTVELNLFLESQWLEDYKKKVEGNHGEIKEILLFNLKRTKQHLHSAVAEVTLKYKDDETQTRNVFFRGKSVVIIPFFFHVDNFSVLMVRQNRIALGGPGLEFPAGGIDPDETPNQAAQRELMEETGISSSLGELINLGDEFIICESAFSETASWFAIPLDEKQLYRYKERKLSHTGCEEIISLAVVSHEELLKINTFQVHCGLSLLKNYLKYFL